MKTLIKAFTIAFLLLLITSGTVLASNTPSEKSPVSLGQIACVSGSIYKPDGNLYQPDDIYWVDLVLRGSDGKDVAWTGIKGDGSYSFEADLPDGRYMLYAMPRGQYGGVVREIEIINGMPLVIDLHLTEAVITGRVLDPEGNVFIIGEYCNPDAGVFLYKAGGNEEFVCQANIARDGTYSLGGIAPGTYRLHADSWNGSKYTGAVPITIELTEGQAVYQDIRLTAPLVKGVIYNYYNHESPFIPSDNSSVYVKLRKADNSGEDLCGNVINGDGTYVLGGDIPAGDYLIVADANGSENTNANSIPEIIHLTEGQTLTHDISLSMPVINGNVLKPDGTPFIPSRDSGVYVKLRNADNSGEDICGTGVNEEGFYKLGGSIPQGDYLLCADTYGTDNPFAASVPLTIHIELGQTLTQNISLSAPLITGTVFTPDNTPFIPGADSGVYVKLRNADYSGEDLCGGSVNDQGIFKLGGNIPAGNYWLAADANGENNPYANAKDILITVTEGHQLTQDISLTMPCLKGNVLLPDGSPFAYIRNENFRVDINLFDKNTGNHVYGWGVNNNGTYKIPGYIESGAYILRVDNRGMDSLYGDNFTEVNIVFGETAVRDISLNPLIYFPVSGGQLAFNAYAGSIIKYEGSPCQVVIPDTISGYYVKSVGENAFLNCDTLQSTSLPSCINKLENMAFGNCAKLQSLYFYGNAPQTEGGIFKNITSGFTVYRLNSGAGFDDGIWKDLTVQEFTPQGGDFGFKGSTLGDTPGTAAFPAEGGQHYLFATYQNNLSAEQKTTFYVAVKKNNELLKVYTEKKDFAPYESYSFNHMLDIPEISESDNIEVCIYLWDGQGRLMTRTGRIKYSITAY